MEAQYPEHEKLGKIADHSQAIGGFLEWLPTQGIHLMRQDSRWDQETWVPNSEQITTLLARFFQINEGRIEAEKRAMLTTLRDRY